ncbi:MAG: hypothetical protein IJR34_03000 [Bacteroidales bacterium]|nr:hypothetical protein [Bacteroidales bacterium]MBQ9597203.1 hypothetical protein [Bacteroidales bacterium]MCR4564508.1 hypothetical protein [Bacteroidales bacterium]
MNSNKLFAISRSVYAQPCAREVRLASGKVLCASIAGSGTTDNYSEVTLEWDD